MAFEPRLLDPRRSAHASIRGYLYQACLGARRWLELEEGEALLCEGDEDLDRLLLDGRGGLSEQVKALAGDVNVRELRDTLRHFLGSYVALLRGGEARRFLFTTTARRRRQRTGDLGVDVLDAWGDLSRRREVIAAVRELVAGDADDGAREALAWLDGEDGGWDGFFDAVEWHFEAPDLDTVRRQIGQNLAARPETRDLPEEALVDRIVAEVLFGSTRSLPAERVLTRKDLERFLGGIRTELAEWAASPSAARLRGIFAELQALDRLLYDGRRPLPAGEVRPGKLLTAAYEVVPFEEEGRREDLEALAAWCARETPRSVQLLTGESPMYPVCTPKTPLPLTLSPRGRGERGPERPTRSAWCLTTPTGLNPTAQGKHEARHPGFAPAIRTLKGFYNGWRRKGRGLVQPFQG